MKTKTNIKLIVSGLILVIFTTDIFAQLEFSDASGVPVVGYGSPGEWDDGVIWGAKIIKDGDTLRMWYTGHHGSIWNSDYSHIGYAWSLDGVEWTKHDDPGTTETPYAYSDPVLSADQTWEGGWVTTGPVIKDGDTLKMWYGANEIGFAVSMDGKNWTKNPEPVELNVGPNNDWDDAMLAPYTIIKEDGEYIMWYSGSKSLLPGEDAYPQVGLANSPDGLTWTKYNDPTTQNAPYAASDPVMKVGSTGEWDSHRTFEPWVMKTDTGYLMFYAGLKGPINYYVKQQLGLASSTDGIEWIRYEYNPIIRDDHSVVLWGRSFYNGAALFYDDHFHYWFSPFIIPPYQARPQIGYAVSDAVGIIDYQQNAQFQSFYNWPNPFLTSTTIEYKLTTPTTVLITIYNHLGEQVKKIKKKQSQGIRQEVWNAEGLPAGVYFCVLKSNVGIQTTKIIKL